MSRDCAENLFCRCPLQNGPVCMCVCVTNNISFSTKSIRCTEELTVPHSMQSTLTLRERTAYTLLMLETYMMNLFDNNLLSDTSDF